MTRTKVVHVVVAGEVGGAERMLVDLATRPVESGADHAVALITPEPRLAELLRDAGMRVHEPEAEPEADRARRRAARREGPLVFLWQTLGPRPMGWIASVLRAEGAQIAHLHTLGSHVVGTRAAARAGARVVRTEHSTRAFDDPTAWPFSRWSLARADASVAVSHHVRYIASSRAPWAGSTMHVVANGVDTDRFAPRQTARSAQLTFAVVGRLERRKGVDLAIEALSHVPGAHLEIVGDGPEQGALVRLAAARGVAQRVTFRGYVKDAREAFSRAEAALCSSRSEGLGIALLEAMSQAVPVVGFAVGGVPEIVEDERTGLLARAGDVGALAARMRDAVGARDRMRTLGEAARAAVVARFSAQSMCHGYAEVYGRVMDQAGRTAPSV